ncbi:MAG: protein kinase [Pseudomonadota bacterium]
MELIEEMETRSLRCIGKYQINALLGSGSMGRVYKVTIPILQKTAALKLFMPTPALIKKTGMEWLKDKFIQEACIIANIRHPNVVDIWSLEKTESGLLYLMEYYCRNLGTLMGESYFADRPARKLSIEKACGYLIQILEGLSRLHEAKIIHRDIKPFNIMLTDMGTAKIVDFGLSKRRGEKHDLPAEKLMIGTSFYAAPEQIESPDQVDARADLYSTGVLLYRMLTGILPEKEPILPSKLEPQLDHTWDQFFMKALAADPDGRFQNAGSMSDELKQLCLVYKTNKKKECSPPDALFNSNKGSDGKKKTIHLRSAPSRILAKHARSIFNLDDLHQPETYLKNDFERKPEKIIIDQATHLAWLQSGSLYPMHWQDAQEYVQGLSEANTGGYKNWRLPTINELLSLLNPMFQEDFCLEPMFSKVQKWLWSADTRSKKSAWTVDVEMGFVRSSDVLDYYYVKGVCSL